jgi:quercetin dioxygenase-like cupin family protein
MTVRIVEFRREAAQPITLFDSSGAFSVALADGNGEAHVYCVHIEPGGCIGAHDAGFGQLFLVVQGSGWAAGADGARVALRAGQGALFERGERHSKGSDEGMTVIMVQVGDLQPTDSRNAQADDTGAA